jgi:hypothetical protein
MARRGTCVPLLNNRGSQSHARASGEERERRRRPTPNAEAWARGAPRLAQRLIRRKRIQATVPAVRIGAQRRSGLSEPVP